MPMPCPQPWPVSVNIVAPWAADAGSTSASAAKAHVANRRVMRTPSAAGYLSWSYARVKIAARVITGTIAMRPTYSGSHARSITCRDMGLLSALPKPVRTVLETVVTLVVALGIAWLGQAFVVKPYRVPTPSMVPTLEPGDRVLADRLSLDFADPGRGQIVVFHPPHCRCGHNDAKRRLHHAAARAPRTGSLDDVRQARDRPARRDGLGQRRPRVDQGQGQAGLPAARALHARQADERPAPRRRSRRATTSCSATTASSRTTRACGASSRAPA